MGTEFSMMKDLATISATLGELSAVQQLIREEIDNPGFLEEFDLLLIDIVDTYEVVADILRPLVSLSEFSSYKNSFELQWKLFNENYQKALSKPRINAEFTFEKYLQFRKRKETKTGYPPLKRAFGRLHDLVDKWIDNDIWLAMTIDSLLKKLFNFLAEVAELHSQDPTSAFSLFRSCVGVFCSNLAAMDETIGDLKRVLTPNVTVREEMAPF